MPEIFFTYIDFFFCVLSIIYNIAGDLKPIRKAVNIQAVFMELQNTFAS